jgi:hypothetical protein
MTYEYRVEHLHIDAEDLEVIELLNKMAEDGFKLVSTVYMEENYYRGNIRYFFLRESSL